MTGSVEDREVLREVWEGRIPTVFTLAEEDVTEESSPDPFYLLLPRMSYLPLTSDKIYKHFCKEKPTENQQDLLWFQYKGTPLKWHHPIGALYDLFKGGESLDNDEGLPWQVTVHLSNFPDQTLIPYSSREKIESNYMSNIKEADQLKHGGRVVSTMLKKDHMQLWAGLQNDKFDQFWAINRRFMETSGDENFKHIPIRFHLSNDGSVMQKLVKPTSETGALVTIGQLKDLYYPSSILVIQGVRPSDSTPLQWLSKHLSYPDNFLHIAIHPA